MIPWRVKSFASRRCPLLYHLAINLGRPKSDEAYWDARLSESWSQRTWPTKNALLERLISIEARVLDVACGNGSILRYLHERGYENLNGLEISQYAVQRLREEGISMRHGTVCRLPYEDKSMDVVIASQVLEHIIRRNRFAREMHRVLKPNGRVFIFVPDDCLSPIDEPEHVAVYTRASLKRFMEKWFVRVSVERIKDANHEAPLLFGQGIRTVVQ